MDLSIASSKTKKDELALEKKAGKSFKIILRNSLLACGILSSLLYAGMNIFAATRYEGYNSASQTVSELSAIGAPSRTLWISLGIVYTLLVIAFGWATWQSAGAKRSLRITAGLMIANVIFGLFWPPMHQREVLAAGGGSLSDTLHIVWAIATVPLMLLAIGFGAASFGKRFRIYSIGTIIMLAGFGILTGLASPRIEANLPTPWIGVWERISIAAYMLWVIVLAITLLRNKKCFSNAVAAINRRFERESAW